MSCEAVAAASMLWLASFSAGDAPPLAPAAVSAPAASVSPLVSEPLFADIIGRAGSLSAQVAAWKGQTISPEAMAAFHAKLTELAGLDMQGHLLLKQRGTDGDLKCILRGISEDLPLKMQAVEAAKDGPTRDAALTDLGYLLRDNVEVITAPPAPEV
jgi:hypothetical protein